MDQWLPLAEALDLIEKKHGVRLYRGNLTTKSKTDKVSKSYLEGLEQDGLARGIYRGQRRFWEISSAAIPRLLEVAASARPGPAPGDQIALDTEQIHTFVNNLAGREITPESLRGALTAATGLNTGVKRIIIPLNPRKPKL